MIRHIVLVRFRPDVPQGEIERIFAALHALRQRIEGIAAIQGGPDASPEGLARGHTHAFTVDFVDRGARDRYLADADHAKVGAALVAAAEGGLAGLTVIDFDL